ncbi:MAG TPA: tetratricopeptide repeat protein [Methylomirabilota bacterium]|nr:tetratricopeptide repeat protein [Methylomirabilota bacterium]
MTVAGPTGVEGALIQAFAYLRAGQHEPALRAARGVIAAEPREPAPHLLAGEALRHLSRGDEAGRHLREALALAPEWAMVHIALAAFHRERREHSKAERHALKAIELDPMESAGWSELGLVYHEQGDQVNAQRCVTRALQIAPRSAPALNLLGSIRLASPETTLEAAEAFRQALAADPRDAFSKNNLGVACMEKGDHAGAERHFRQALAARPTQPIFRRNLYAALRGQSRAYRLLTLPCQLSLSLSGTYGGYLGTAIGAGVWVLILNILADPYGPFQDVRLGAMALIAWLVLVWWPSLTLYERLTLRDVQSRAGEVPSRVGHPDLASGSLRVRLGLFVLALLGGGAAIGVAITHPLVETFVTAFLAMAAISTAASLLIVKALETIAWRARGRRLHARPDIG